ncbi:hypothetical protein NC651_009817 [Populus alba x Populus x berolinensis]|nr:hypothetical protein NC651_009817 [Populus alba x Populus x berolinensis]
MTSSSSIKETTEEEQVAPDIVPADGGAGGVEKTEPVSSGGEEESGGEKLGDSMEEDSVSPATVFCIRLKQQRSNLQHKMSVPSFVANTVLLLGCGQADTLDSFFVHQKLVQERFPVYRNGPLLLGLDALLIANFQWEDNYLDSTFSSPSNLVRDASCFGSVSMNGDRILQLLLNGYLGSLPVCRWLSSKSSIHNNTHSKSAFEEKFLSQHSQTSGFGGAFRLVLNGGMLLAVHRISAAEDGHRIHLHSVIAVLDADFSFSTLYTAQAAYMVLYVYFCAIAISSLFLLRSSVIMISGNSIIA